MLCGPFSIQAPVSQNPIIKICVNKGKNKVFVASVSEKDFGRRGTRCHQRKLIEVKEKKDNTVSFYPWFIQCLSSSVALEF